MTDVPIGTVSHVFAIRGRGIGVLFVDSPDHIATRDKLDIVVARPDGSSATYSAYREFARTARSATGEVVALSILGATLSDIPIGSVVTAAALGGTADKLT